MTSRAYSAALDACLSELAKLVSERAAKAERINELDEKIRSRLETAMTLSKQVPGDNTRHKQLLLLAGQVPATEPQLTEAVLDVLYQSEGALNAKEVKTALELARFDFSGFSNPLASIHSTLRRLSTRPHIRTEQGPSSKTVYRWTGTRYGARRSLANMLAAPKGR